MNRRLLTLLSLVVASSFIALGCRAEPPAPKRYVDTTDRLTPVTGDLSRGETEAAFSALGLTMRRFQYRAAERHRLRLWTEVYEHDRDYPEPVIVNDRTSDQSEGKHEFAVFMRRHDRTLHLSMAYGDDRLQPSQASTLTVYTIPAMEGGSHWDTAQESVLTTGQETEVARYYADREGKDRTTRPLGRGSLLEAAKHNDLVVAVFMKLEAPASEMP